MTTPMLVDISYCRPREDEVEDAQYYAGRAMMNYTRIETIGMWVWQPSIHDFTVFYMPLSQVNDRLRAWAKDCIERDKLNGHTPLLIHFARGEMHTYGKKMDGTFYHYAHEPSLVKEAHA